jgi:DNA-directed RNA polymerase specialized sigma24 family protein
MRQLERERAKLERQSLRNAQKRDKAIRKAHAAGLTMREIATIANMSHQRIGQIVKRGRQNA